MNFNHALLSIVEIQGYVTGNGRLQMESGPYYYPAVYDPEPQAFSEVKRRGREEVEKRRKRRVLHLLDMLKTTDLSVISKTPSQLCVLVAEDGFLVASHSPEGIIVLRSLKLDLIFTVNRIKRCKKFWTN